MLGNFYRYEHTFDEEARLSNGTYSNMTDFKDLKQANEKEYECFKIQLRREKLEDEECIICLEPLN